MQTSPLSNNEIIKIVCSIIKDGQISIFSAELVPTTSLMSAFTSNQPFDDSPAIKRIVIILNFIPFKLQSSPLLALKIQIFLKLHLILPPQISPPISSQHLPPYNPKSHLIFYLKNIGKGKIKGEEEKNCSITLFIYIKLFTERSSTTLFFFFKRSSITHIFIYTYI